MPAPLRILMELRPALDGHAGIPQASRLLFSSLSRVDGYVVEGLLQSNTHALARGLPARPRTGADHLSPDRKLDRLARVVVSLEHQAWDSYFSSVPMLFRCLLGRSEDLTRFEAECFRDFIWQRLFDKSLLPKDFDTVTRAGFRIVHVPWAVMQRFALAIKGLGRPLYPRLDTSDFDVMIAETPYPATVSKGTRFVIRYHDAFPMLMPHTVASRRYHQASHYSALKSNVKSGAWFVCVSNATRRDLVSIFPQVEEQSVTIHNMVSQHYFDEPSPAMRVPAIVRARLNVRIHPKPDSGVAPDGFDAGSAATPFDYLLAVSTLEPRKNHLTLLASWEALHAETFPSLKLVVVGEPGWHHDAIIDRFRPWMRRGDVLLLSGVPAPELRVLYKHARATVCPSLAEGFDFSGVEAMASGGAVVASDIPAHREIYGDAAEYFDPYCSDQLALAIRYVIDTARSPRRQELLAVGAATCRRYSQETILPQWESFLTSVCGRA